MNAYKERMTIKDLLFNPFEYIAGFKALIIGLVIIFLAGLIGSVSNSHFDGVLDLHTGMSSALWVYLVEGCINWISMIIVLLLVGKIFSKTKFRLIDLAGTQAMARIPTLISSLAVLITPFQKYSKYVARQITQQGADVTVGSLDAVMFYVVLLIIICTTIWMAFLMYRSFSISCNLKGTKAVILFIIGIIIAEIISKVALMQLYKI